MAGLSSAWLFPHLEMQLNEELRSEAVQRSAKYELDSLLVVSAAQDHYLKESVYQKVVICVTENLTSQRKSSRKSLVSLWQEIKRKRPNKVDSFRCILLINDSMVYQWIIGIFEKLLVHGFQITLATSYETMLLQLFK